MIALSRNWQLFVSLSSGLLLVALGTGFYHVRWAAGAAPTELIGWSILIAITALSLTVEATRRFGTGAVGEQRRVLTSIGATSVILAIVPFWIVEYAMTTAVILTPNTAFSVLFVTVLAMVFISAAQTTVELDDRSERRL